MLTVTLILKRFLCKKSSRRAAGATVRVLKVSGFSRRQRQRRAETSTDTACMSPNAHLDLGQRPDQSRVSCAWVATRCGDSLKNTRLQEKDEVGVVSRPGREGT